MTSERVQTVRNAWINAIRDEALRMRRPEVSKAAHIGVWIASYADADGSNAWPSGETLAAIAGCTRDTVIRCVKLLVAVGLLEKRRRPNKSAVYQLVIPVQRPDWQAHMDVWGESRQAQARRKAKEKEVAELLAKSSPDDNRKSSPDATQQGSEVVPGGTTGSRPGTTTEQFGSRPRTPPEVVPGRLPEVVPGGGGDQYLPTSGRDPQPDHDMAEHPPKPQVGAGARPEDDQSPRGKAAFPRCAECGDPMAPRPGRTTHTHCTPAQHRSAS